MRLDTATVEQFEPVVGETFSVEAGAVELQLVAAVPAAHPGPDGARHPFALTFLGPMDPPLGQGTYRLDHATLGELEIFIVPVGRDDAGTSYEAVFS